MTHDNGPLADLRTHLAEVEDVRYAAELLGWDQQTMMPAQGAAARAAVLRSREVVGPGSGGGQVEDIKGKAKQAAGKAAGSKSLQREGKAQVKKASHATKAQSEQSKAKAAKAEEKSARRSR